MANNNTPPSTPPVSPISSCKWKRGRPVYAPYAGIRSRHSAPANWSPATARPSTRASESPLTAQHSQICHGSSGQTSAPRSMLSNKDLSDSLGRMSLVEAPRALHFAPTARMEAQHITLPEIPSQPPIQGSIEQAVKGDAVNTHQKGSGAHTKDQITTRTGPAVQDEHTMNHSSDSDYVPSQEPKNNLEDRKSGSGSEENETMKEEEEEDTAKEEHIDLKYQIPAETLRAAMLATPNTRASFWSASMYRGPEGQSISTHYCRTKEVAERVAQYFLAEKVVGFDIEWKPYGAPQSIKANASLIQLACEDRIALFHISQFAGTTPAQLMPPTLKIILESPDIYKVGVAVKGDFTRLQRYLDVQPQGVFELSRLHNLVEGYGKDKKLSASNKFTRLAHQVLQHLQLPLYKGSQLADDPADTANVRESDWSKPLNSQQIHYAAADAYAGFRLYHILEWKRKQLRPTPPTRGICDNDAKRIERPKAPTEKKVAIKSKDADASAKRSSSAAELVQEPGGEQVENAVEEEGRDEENGYETAPEETIDSHELEDATSSSLNDAEPGTANADNVTHEYIRSHKRVGRVDMSWLRGPDPGYPSLPQDESDISTSTRNEITPDMTHPITGGPNAVHPNSVPQLTPREDEDDEFADPDLEYALQDLDLDADGKLTESTLEKDQYRVHFPGPTSTIIPPSEAHASRLTQPGSLEFSHSQISDELTAHESKNPDIDQLTSATLPDAEAPTAPDDNTHSTEYALATTWAQEYLQSTIPSPSSTERPRIRATTAHLRAYHLWHQQKLSIEDAASHLRDPPLAHSTVSGYVLQAVNLERLEYDNDTMRGVLMTLPTGLRNGRWKKMVEEVG